MSAMGELVCWKLDGDSFVVDLSGIDFYDGSEYNNQTLWEMEEEVKRACGRLLNEDELADVLQTRTITNEDMWVPIRNGTTNSIYNNIVKLFYSYMCHI